MIRSTSHVFLSFFIFHLVNFCTKTIRRTYGIYGILLHLEKLEIFILFRTIYGMNFYREIGDLYFISNNLWNFHREVGIFILFRVTYGIFIEKLGIFILFRITFGIFIEKLRIFILFRVTYGTSLHRS